jgi:hypothetical protein
MVVAPDESGTRQGDVQVNHDVSASNMHGNAAVSSQHQHQQQHQETHANLNTSGLAGLGGSGSNGNVGAVGGGQNIGSIEALKTAVAASDPDALTKLLEHIESLKHSNAEMSETLDGIQKKNMEKYHVEVQEKIQPWVTSLNIPEDQKASFLQGIQLACEQGMKKRGIIDFQSNPAFSIACAAAEAHGSAIQSAENFRVQLLEANTKVERIKEEESTNYNNNRMRQHAILSSALTDDTQSDMSKKRKSAEMYNDKSPAMDAYDAPATTCWTTVFNKMLPGGDNMSQNNMGGGGQGYRG